jgi:hypothetical protein
VGEDCVLRYLAANEFMELEVGRVDETHDKLLLKGFGHKFVSNSDGTGLWPPI